MPVKGTALGRTACSLPWLCPSAEVLTALTELHPQATQLQHDVAFCAHVARFARPSLTAEQSPWSREHLLLPSLVAAAGGLLSTLDRKGCLSAVAWPSSFAKQLDEAAEFAESLGQSQGLPAGQLGWLVRLSQLGWAALSAVDPVATRDCWTDPRHRQDPAAVEKLYFGLEQINVLRRLAESWRFPRWLTALLTTTRLPVPDAIRLGAPGHLVPWLRQAIAPLESRQHLEWESPTPARTTLSPELVTVLSRCLQNTAEHRRRQSSHLLATAESRVDELTELLAELRAEFEHELRDAKLAGLAEFAAGAGHEINNPLTIISGNIQLMLSKETDPAKQKTLHTLIRQTKRIYDILQGTRWFARPSAPRQELIDLARWLPGVVNPLIPEADQKALAVTMDFSAKESPAYVSVDPGHLKQIMGHVLQNAIEAAPRGGWVRVILEASYRSVRILIEDNGPGPTPEQIPHLFDPFFSGRDAGRGRGLGLSIAWRLAQLNSGDVRFHRTTDEKTRFLISFPRAESPARIVTKSA